MQKENAKNKKVFVGMSGGVDSSVSAYLLKRAGFDVTGVFIKVWQPDFMTCSWKEDRRDAMRVASQIGIPFLTINAEEEYKKDVVDYMIKEYKAGRTPNPDVMCNNSVKFGVFYRKAMEMGADYIATGHYAKRLEKDKNVFLGIPKDSEKDQTYFLWNISKESLGETIFPLGDMEKKEVRKIAKEASLFTAEKKDSQGLCFIGKVSMKDFLSHYLKLQKGNVLDEKGNVIGEHDGALLYTNGQRHGILITKKTPQDTPYYVISRDIKENTVTVSMDGGHESFSDKKTSVVIEKVNLLADISESTEIFARVRYRQPLSSCSLEKNGDGILVHFNTNIPVVSIGQSCVLYDNIKCIGGGIISEVL